MFKLNYIYHEYSYGSNIFLFEMEVLLYLEIMTSSMGCFLPACTLYNINDNGIPINLSHLQTWCIVGNMIQYITASLSTCLYIQTLFYYRQGFSQELKHLLLKYNNSRSDRRCPGQSLPFLIYSWLVPILNIWRVDFQYKINHSINIHAKQTYFRITVLMQFTLMVKLLEIVLFYSFLLHQYSKLLNKN